MKKKKRMSKQEWKEFIDLCKLINKHHDYPDKHPEPKYFYEMNIDPKIKRKIQRLARVWYNYIKEHSKLIKHPYDYHESEMNFIEIFFFRPKKEKMNVVNK